MKPDRSGSLGSEAWRSAKVAGGLLGLAALTQSTACLDEPPTFAPRDQIPPFIVAGQAFPHINLIYDGPIPFAVNVPFRSEDVNRALRARLYPDLVPGVAEARHRAQQDIPAGIYEDTSRSVTMDWTEQFEEAGCHSLTLILTYQNNFDPITQLPIDDSQAARLVWWLNVDDVTGASTLSSCPSEPPPGAVSE